MTKGAINYSASSSIPIIIGADCNAHHSLWNSSDTNRRGELLVEYLTTTCLDIQNVGCEPTFANKIRQEVIDITLMTQNLSNRIKNWAVSCEETLSDHKEINSKWTVKLCRVRFIATHATQTGTYIKMCYRKGSVALRILTKLKQLMNSMMP